MPLSSRFESQAVSADARRNRCRPLLVFLLLASALALFAPRGYGQIYTASITGTVRDASGAVIPDAALVLTNAGTGIEKTGRNQRGWKLSAVEPSARHVHLGGQ